MQLDYLSLDPPGRIGAEARKAESIGYRTVRVGETRHDPMLQSFAATITTSEVKVGTAVVVAFGRSPLTVAHSAFDLTELSRGRFSLGLGSQVRSHIERRFSMPWSSPIERMEEFVMALRAIWASWLDGVPLAFDGRIYRHTLMTPFFSPPAHPFGPPPVLLAGSHKHMAELAGRVADGLIFHPFSSREYLLDEVLPSVAAGRSKSERPAGAFEICGAVLASVHGGDVQADADADRALREHIAFYGSTREYTEVLAHHGCGDLHTELASIAKLGRWAEMGGAIDDELVDILAVRGPAEHVAAELERRYGDFADSVSLVLPGADRSGADEVARLMAV
jgi:probable F420-dependent oxidoreductase